MQDNSKIIYEQDDILKIRIGENSNPNDISELISMFLPRSAYELDLNGPPLGDSKDDLKRIIYKALVDRTGQTLEWGILTGVKPLKLYASFADKYDKKDVIEKFERDYFVSKKSLTLLSETYATQKNAISSPEPNTVSIYIGIPFCPTRCAYCSFTSNVAKPEAIKEYLSALLKEIKYVSNSMLQAGFIAESVYIGGGTPTTLSSDELKLLLSEVKDNIPCKDDCEFTVEAGRPDTITSEKCRVLSDYNIDRISINPQSMNLETLKRIGRNHVPEDIVRAFEIARSEGDFIINADIIAGLPEENKADFDSTINKILDLRPENITIHTLSIKKGSELREVDAELCYNSRGMASVMLDDITQILSCARYKPYYLYRQKNMLDNLENVGYALPNTECIYNMRIMEEKQTIIALGAGGSSKVYFPKADRIERVFNVSNYEIYIARIDEMIKRKEDGLFKPLMNQSGG